MAIAKVPADAKEYQNISIASHLDTTRGGIHFVLVGAGGNGARLVPPLMQILHPSDRLSILDHDVVEDRNLGRQHFAPQDVGQYKALVLTERYRRRLAGQEIPISAHTTQLTEDNAAEISRGLNTGQHVAVIYIGCVDNAAARRAILKAMHSAEQGARAWVDVGNAFKDGQVILTMQNWPVNMKLDGASAGLLGINLRGMELAMPQLLVTRPEDAEEASCQDRVDLQSVMINVQAASSALNVLSWLKLRTPIMTAGSFFSSLCAAQPIKIQKYSGGRSEVIPETSFAAQD